MALTMRGAIGAGSGVTTGQIPGYTRPEKDVDIYRHEVSPAYFETLKIPILLGRDIQESDGKDAPKVVVINEAFARKFFHGDNPLGHTIDLGRKTKPEPYEIVGVAHDVKYAQIRRDIPPTAYFA